jgi:hypothetical protein
MAAKIFTSAIVGATAVLRMSEPSWNSNPKAK